MSMSGDEQIFNVGLCKSFDDLAEALAKKKAKLVNILMNLQVKRLKIKFSIRNLLAEDGPRQGLGPREDPR